MGNLAWDVTDGELRAAFAEYVEVEKAEVVKDRETGRSKGFGFVTLCASSDIGTAIEQCGDMELRGRKIRVDKAQPRRENDRSGNRDVEDYRRHDRADGRRFR